MGQSTPSAAADEVAYAQSSLGDRLVGFEIGNEPDLYRKNGYRSATYAYADFKAEWESFAAAIRVKTPGAILTGPAAAGNVAPYTLRFATDGAVNNSLLTQHYYIADGKDPASTVAAMLTPDPRLGTILPELAKASGDNHMKLGFRIAECNSFYNGGAAGVSDSYASALWVGDFLFAIAASGASGVNLHGGGNGPGYTPIADANGLVLQARPEYYGAALFALAANGRLLATEMSGGAPMLSAYAVLADDGATSIVIVNKDSNAVTVAVDAGVAVSVASVIRLGGPALSATSGVLLGGVPIGNDGSWNPPTPSSLPTNGTRVTVEVAGASAAYVRAL
jgi:hypothetical protein